MKSDHIQKVIDDFIDEQGLNFQPLRSEILDHLMSDVTCRMQRGSSFDEAWKEVKSEIPFNHFREIQQQTMETIDSRFRIFTYLFLGLIILGSLFKFLHLPGAAILLLASFGAIVLSLLTSAASGVFMNKSKRGSIWVVAMVLGVIILLIAFGFRIFHLPGVEMLAFTSVILLSLSAVFISWKVHQNKKHEASLLTFLHEKYTPGIQRSLFILLTAGVILKVPALIKGTDYFVGDITLIMIIYGAGIQLIALFWKSMELRKPDNRLLILAIISAISLFLTILNFYIPLAPRLVLGGVFYLAAGILVYQLQDAHFNKTLVMLFIVLNLIHFTTWILVELGVIQDNLNTILFSLPITLIWIASFWVFRKNRMMLTYMIITFASYMVQYAA